MVISCKTCKHLGVSLHVDPCNNCVYCGGYAYNFIKEDAKESKITSFFKHFAEYCNNNKQGGK